MYSCRHRQGQDIGRVATWKAPSHPSQTTPSFRGTCCSESLPVTQQRLPVFELHLRWIIRDSVESSFFGSTSYVCVRLICIVLCTTANSLPQSALPSGYTPTHFLVLCSMAPGLSPGHAVSLKLLGTFLSVLVAAGRGLAVASGSRVFSFWQLAAGRCPGATVPVPTLAGDGREPSGSARSSPCGRVRPFLPRPLRPARSGVSAVRVFIALLADEV